MEIENSVTVVTGAGSGIGRSLAEAFGVAGAAVVAADVDDAAAEATAQRIRTDGGRCVALQADAAATDGIEAMIGLADAQYGPVDIFVANAGIVGPPGLGDEAAWEQTLDVNLLETWKKGEERQDVRLAILNQIDEMQKREKKGDKKDAE